MGIGFGLGSQCTGGQGDKSQFDIALLGYGAYDMPLGVAIKRDGRQGSSS